MPVMQGLLAFRTLVGFSFLAACRDQCSLQPMGKLFGKTCFGGSLLILVLLGTSCSTAPKPQQEAEIATTGGTGAELRSPTLLSPAEFVANYSKADEQAVLIDCRTPAEFSRGALPDAINLDYKAGQIASVIETTPKDRPVYVYCQAGGRSAAAAQQLQQAGFTKVFDMQGGYGAYSAQRSSE